MKKEKAIRWSKWRAAQEFGIDQKTLTGRLTRYGIEEGDDKCFSTKQICDAIYGDIDGEKLRLTKEQADEKALSNAERRRELIPSDEFVSVAERGLQSMVATVMGMTDIGMDHREKIIEQIREAGIALARVGGSYSDSAAALHGCDMG
tara:strand:+ start:1065 stop:1508 length:444 start_codon:yes stop_codon:yes gene_type:complete